MNRGAVLGIRRTPTDVERGGCAALGAGTTVAGVASSRASAAPSRVPSMTDSLEVQVLYPARWR
jgi:hypothetical protein